MIYRYLCLLQINIWSYSDRKLLQSVETGHTANIFCTKFIPETSDDLVVSGAGDAEVMFSRFHLYFSWLSLCTNGLCLYRSTESFGF